MSRAKGSRALPYAVAALILYYVGLGAVVLFVVACSVWALGPLLGDGW